MSVALKFSNSSSFSNDGFTGIGSAAMQCSLDSRFEIGLSCFPSRWIHLNSKQSSRQLRIRCFGSETSGKIAGQPASMEGPKVLEPEIDGEDGSGSSGGDGNYGGGNGNHGGGGNGDDEGEDEADKEEEREFGPILNFEEVIKETKGRGVKLPEDMLAAAKSTGVRELFLTRYLDLQGSVWPLGFLMKRWSMLRNRMLADPTFLFKVGTEIAIDSVSTTFAEYQKRGKAFWSEFELYAADLLVGIAVDMALVGLLAPYARIKKSSAASKGSFNKLRRTFAALPSSVFEAERPGCKFSVMQRTATYFYKGVLYGSVGFGCGLIGQGFANLVMTAKRSIKSSEEDVPVPPLFQSAALWGVFLGVSSNTRYQIVNGLERFVESSAVAKSVPVIAMAFTVGVRFANNIYGGMQFVEWAKLTGVQ